MAGFTPYHPDASSLGAPAGGCFEMNPRVVGLLVLNLGAALWYVSQHRWPWVLIYVGAAVIQLGCLWATR